MVSRLSFYIGDAIRKIRLKADLPLEDVARRAGIAIPRLAQIEAGAAATTLDELFALKLALNVSVQELLRELREAEE